MRLGALTSSVSQKGGGLYDAVFGAAQALQVFYLPEIWVFGLEDERTQEDLGAWGTVPVQVFPIRGPHAFGYAPGLSKALQAADLDLLHVHGLWMYTSVASLAWNRQRKRPHLITPHGMLDPWAVRNSHWKKRLAGLLYEHTHLRHAACLQALCEAEAEAIRAYGLRNPIAVIPNGIELPSKSPMRDTAGRQKILLYLGRLHPKKNLRNLLYAWQLLGHRDTNSAGEWKLFIAGWEQSGYGAELKALSRQLGIEQTVHFMGPRFGKEKEAVYRAADAFALPSLSEGLPMAVLEAWAYGLPVLMTPQCNLPEGFQAEAAIRIQADIDAISQGLETLILMTEGERYTMGRRGRKLVEEYFSWPKIAVEMYAVYRWVLGGGEKPGCIIN